ncbi:hypothetical protein QJQ45_008714 [Haematococcus lacustris]|nr:hypothetical protein QJQ45_008714 [Haematococcus lacustris]
MRPLSLGSASSFKRPFFYSQFGPIVDGKRQCLHCPAQLAATEVSNPTHLRTHLLTSKKCGFLLSTAAAEIAKTESCVASKLPASSTQNLPTPPTPTHALFNWVVQEAIPFSVVESPAFQAFVAALNPSFVLPSRYSVDLVALARIKAHVDAVRDMVKFWTRSTFRASRLLHFRGVHGIGMGLHLPCATRMHSAATMMESLEVNKAALTSAVTDSSYERPGLDVKQQQRSASIKEDTLRAGFWDDNKAILQLMYPVTQFQVDLQSDTANMADVFYGATAIEMHYGQQAGGAAVGNQDPAALAAAQRVLCIPATAAANERVFSSFKHIWSDKRSSLLLGRMWLLAFIYFNKRVLERRPKPQPEAEWQQFAQWMQHMPVEA